jgi:hypothetical protein
MRPPSCLISGTHLRLRKVFADANRDEWHCCNTGVLLHETYLITRRHSMVLEQRDPVSVDALPLEWHLVATGAADHLTHSRLISQTRVEAGRKIRVAPVSCSTGVETTEENEGLWARSSPVGTR